MRNERQNVFELVTQCTRYSKNSQMKGGLRGRITQTPEYANEYCTVIYLGHLPHQFLVGLFRVRQAAFEHLRR